MKEKSPWTTLSSRTVYDAKLFTLREDQTRNEQAGVRPYTWTQFRVFGVTVLPVDDDGCTYVVGQHRYPTGRYTWELVRGAGDLAVPAQDSAARELREETGLTARRWRQMMSVTASPGTSDEIAPCFVAWELTAHSAQPDPGEKLRVRRLRFVDAVTEVLDGVIADGCSAALVLAVQARLMRGDLPADLSERLARGC